MPLVSDIELLTDDFHQHALLTPAIKLAIKNLLPWSEVQLTSCDRNDDLATHHLSLNVSVSVIFSSLVVMITADGFVWRELFKPDFIIVMQPTFVIVNENRSGDMHR